MATFRRQRLLSILVTWLMSPVYAAIAQPISKDNGNSNAKTVVSRVDALINRGTVAVIHVDLGAIDRAAFAEPFMKAWGRTDEERQLFREQTQSYLDMIVKGGGSNVYVLFWVSDFMTQPPMIAIPVVENTDAKKLFSMLDFKNLDPNHPLTRDLQAWNVAEWRQYKDFLVASGWKWTMKPDLPKPPTDEEFRDWLAQKPRPEIVEAMNVIVSAPLRVVVAPTPEFRQDLRAYVHHANSPKFLQQLDPLIDGAEWMAIGMRHGNVTDSKPVFECTIQMKTAQQAEIVQSQLKDAAKSWADYGGEFDDPDDAYQSLNQLLPAIVDNRLVLTIEPESKKLEAIEKVTVVFRQRRREDLAVLTRRVQLKQLGLLLHNYHESKHGFPAHAIFDDSAKPLLSWRVMLLPFLGEDELYGEFHVDEPWDSAHNRKLIGKMPKLYQTGNSQLDEAGKTCMLLPAGPDAMFSSRNGPDLKGLTDGTEFTVMAVQADNSHAVVWTSPEDLTIDPKQPLAGMARHWKHGKRMVQLLFADGSTRSILEDESPELLRSLFTPSGHEPHPAWP